MSWRSLTLAPLLAVWAVSAAAEPACPIPPELALDIPALPASKAVLARHEPLKIVALGSAPTEGSAAGDPQLTYPARLQAHLAGALPGRDITVLNKGVAHQTTAQMITRIARDVLPEHPTLVIWDAGTVDAARGLDVESFSETLDDGFDKLKAAGIDIIVMDMQYAPSTVSLIDFGPYIDALRAVAERNGVPVFNRFEVMHDWGENGLFSYDETAPDARTATARRVYDCLAAGLADGIAAALK
jgi:acyl-CoA thioesterase I